ncbi:MAG: protein-L-isoaspartate O-methyltransferase [Acidobacteria bacterium]|nr:protein-L-isoaspartate O-methyltransferase [Acidobacteriota bacterium]
MNSWGLPDGAEMKVKELNKRERRELTPLFARYLVHLIRPFPDFDWSRIKPLRQKAVQLLQLKPGDRVLDAGCGPGGSFPYLVEAVGPSGEVVGLEISPEIAINARRRIQKNGWSNVQIIVADARTVKLEGKFDGLLMFAAHDIYTSPQALDNLFQYLQGDARVAAFGAKLSGGHFGWILNPFFRLAPSKLSFPSTPAIDSQPWRLLEERVGALTVEDHFFGWMFLAWGSRTGERNP